MFDLARCVVRAVAESRRESEWFIVQFYRDEVAKSLGGRIRSFSARNLRRQKPQEAYKLVLIRAAVTISFDPLFFAKASRAAGIEENVVEAQAAKFLARARAAIEDALKAADEVAPLFFAS